MIAIYALQLIVGIPGYLFLHRTGRHRLLAYALLGFCIGAILVMALSGSDDDYGILACRPS